ncbi:MAG: T9SS type A sorting domain-containing protein [Bacteroidia bacterium]
MRLIQGFLAVIIVSGVCAQDLLRQWEDKLPTKMGMHQKLNSARISALKLVDTLWHDSWDATAASWSEEDREIYSYDAQGRTSIVLYQSNQGGTWQNTLREKYTYYASGPWQGRLENRVDEEWQSGWQSGSWVISDSMAYAYQTSNPVQTSIFYRWNGSQWQPAERYRFFSGRPDSIMYYDTLNTSNNWDQVAYIRYKYNSANQLDSVIQYYYNTYVATKYNRDGLGRAVTSRDTFSMGGMFTGYGLGFYYYRSATSRQLARDSSQVFTYIMGSPTVVGGEKNTYTYDSDDSLIVQVTGVYDAGRWQNSSRQRWSYVSFASSLPKVSKLLEIENPCKAGSFLSLKLEKPAQVEIWDTQGRQLSQVNLSAGHQRVALPKEPGIYILRVGSYSQRLLLY